MQHPLYYIGTFGNVYGGIWLFLVGPTYLPNSQKIKSFTNTDSATILFPKSSAAITFATENLGQQNLGLSNKTNFFI